MLMATKLGILGAIALCVLALAIATGTAQQTARRRRLARGGATALFAFLSAFFWLSPFTERGGFLTGMAVFFTVGGAISLWKLIAGAQPGAGDGSATH
jgi:hypothetical protein